MMSGHLVVVDRLGREGKKYFLESGIATIGSGLKSDIRVTCPSVSPHHATIVIHNNQAILRSAHGATLVNGRGVSVWRLRHGDALSIGGKHLKWSSDVPETGSPPDQQPALIQRRSRGNKNNRRLTSVNYPNRTKLEIEAMHRASMPASAGGKQVAIVQPQRRDTSLQYAPPTEPRMSPREDRRRSSVPPATQASLWIDSRKQSPRKSAPRQTTPLSTKVRKPAASAKKRTPLRLTVLRKAQSAHKPVVMKIQDPTRIDHTKQAALMLMTGHTPKPKISPKSAKKSPSYIIKKPSPVRKTNTPQGRKSNRGSTNVRVSATPRGSTNVRVSATPSGSTNVRVSATPNSANVTRSSRRGTASISGLSVLEISDSDAQSSFRGSMASHYSTDSPPKSPLLQSPRKSALKDPFAKSNKKNESIKFDLSNLENYNESEDVLVISNSTKQINDSLSESNVTLRFSDASTNKSPSPRRSLSSRSSKIMEKSLGSPLNYTKNQTVERSTLTPGSPSSRKSLRGSLIVQKALENSSIHNSTRGSRTRTLIDESGDHSNSAFRTKTLSPRKSNKSQNMESYSIVDLVSIDSNETARASSVYNSADSINSSVIKFGTPRTSSFRKSKSTIRGSLLSSSTPYVPKANRSKRSNSSPNISTVKSPNLTQSSVVTRRSKSVTTPENTNQSINDTRISRLSRCRSRINDTDSLLLSSNVEDTDDTSPKSSRTITKSSKSTTPIQSTRKTRSINATVTLDDSTINNGLSTPENRRSPVEESTPVLSIKSLLDSSQSSGSSFQSQKKGRRNSKRKTIAVVSQNSVKRGRNSAASKSMVIIPAKKSLRLSPNASPLPDDEIVTPKSAVKIVQEAVKNKHSTAKKPQSKRSIIDDLNESDIVKKLFNSPVKRKLSQSMTEFSRKQLFDDDMPRKATRHTIALGLTRDDSILNLSNEFTPEAFVSPLSTPGHSPNLTSVKRLFSKKSPVNDLRNISGDKALVRSPRTRKSVKNDLTNVSGIKNVFAKSPKNRLSDIRGVKEIFAPSPKNDLRRVTGVKTLFKKQRTPKNDLTDVRGVKSLFKRASPRNDYRNVVGVKKIFQEPPKNDLTDVRGVKNMFGRKKRQTDYNNVSGVEDLFNESYNSNKESSSDRLFDQLVGKPKIKAVYSKSFAKKSAGASKKRAAKSLHDSIDVISSNVEDWLEQELQKRLHKVDKKNTSKRKSRELENLATDTVSGSGPITTSRVRNSTLTKSVTIVSDKKKSASEVYSPHTLPIKKRSIVEASLHKSQNNSQNKSANKSAASRHQLPIKKRVVVHSTPVKGRYNLTMNASELGRVSPIIAEKTKDVHETSITTLPDSKTSLQLKSRRSKLFQQAVVDISVLVHKPSVKVSPKKSRGRSSKASQSRRNAIADETAVSNVIKRRSSVVITKKSPIANPKSAPNSSKTSEPVSPKPVSPKKTRGRKQKSDVQETIKTPKRATRAKVIKDTVVVTKPSPKMKPRGEVSSDENKPNSKTKASSKVKPRGKASEVSSNVSKTYSKRSRRNVSKELPATKGKWTKADVSQQVKEVPSRRTRKTVEVEVASPPAKRGRAADKNQKPEPKAPKRGAKPAKPETPKRGAKLVEPEAPKRGAKLAEPEAPKRGAKSAEPEPSKRGAKQKIPETNPTKATRKTEPVVEVVEKRRGRQIAETVEPEPQPRRGRKAVEAITVEPKTRRGQVIAEVEAPTNKRVRIISSPVVPVVLPEAAPKRGRTKAETNKKTAKKSPSPVKQVKTKGKELESQASTQSEPQTTRGRRNNKPDSVVVENTKTRKATAETTKPTGKLQKSKNEEVVKTTRGRKTTNVEETEAVAKQDKGKKKNETKEESPVRGKSTRGKKNVQFVEEKPARGRKRKSDTSPAKENRSQPAKKSRLAEAAPAPLVNKRSTRATQAVAEAPKTSGRQRRR